MKKIFKYIAILASAVLIFNACDDDEISYTEVEFQAAPTFASAISATSIQDSSFVINFQPSALGAIYYIMQDSSEADITDNLSLIDNGEYMQVTDVATTLSVTFEELVHNTTYEIFAVNVNKSGVPSAIHEKVLVTTDDTYSPVLAGFSPTGQDPRVSATQPIVLTFDEPIASYDNTKTLTYWSYFYGVNYTVPADSIIISGNQVTVNVGLLEYNDYCFLSVEAGAFADYAGNVSEEIESGVVGGYLVGVWFRVERDPATQLPTIFENFLGDYVATDYDNSDSTTVDWGPYGVTIYENTETEEPYDVIIDGFWGWGSGSTFVVTFNTDYTISAQTQELAVTLGNVYGDPFTDEPIYCGIWSPDTYATPYGTWSYSDFSFDMSLLFYNNEYGQVYSDLYQSYVKDDGTKSLKTNRPYSIFEK